VRELLEALRSRGVAVLLNSHLLSEVELVCDRVVIVDRGRVVAEGAPHELTAAGGVEIETAGGMRRYPDAQRADVPGLVGLLVAEGELIYGVRVVTGTLEDAYLGLVGQDAR
jgi:ABC-2 type transport system ATP-binding protein